MTLVAIMGFKLCATTLFVLSLLIAFLSRTGTESAATYVYHICSNATSFTANSTYQSNLNHLLASLISNATRPTGFYSTTASSPNSVETVYGLFLCRGDISSDDCRECVSGAIKDVVERCPKEKDAMAWYEYCMLRYANQDFFSKMVTDPGLYMSGTENTSDPTRFDLRVTTAMTDLLSGVAYDGSGAKKFRTKEANFTALQTLYTLAQCTPDLSGSDCFKCLLKAIPAVPDCCSGKQGGRVLFPSCNVRFEVYPFYKVNTSAPTPSTPALVPPPPGSVTKPKGKDQISAVIIIAIVVPISLSIVLFIGYCFLISRRARKKYNAIQQENGSKRQLAFYNDVTAGSPFFQDSAKLDESGRKSNVQFFDLSTIIAATDNFSPVKRLGQGGFGPVYKGELANGQEIAVKTLSRSSKQGTEEFKNEVKLIAKLQHRNLVRLFGCCIHKEEKMLIYEYMPNKSLDLFIFDEIRRELIDWRQRFEIISGIARGVLYLHQDSRLKIIHRDLKAGNILLDAAMNPKISDFGLARMFGDDQIEANTRKVVGTYGYMSPEYAMEGLYSIKSDVFSYGVLTLEIISGKRNNYHHIGSSSLNLIGHVWDLWMEGKALDIVDSLLGQEYPAQEVLKCIQIGLLCVQEQATNRPTMLEIVFMLGNEATVPSPNKPAFINRLINSGQDFSSSKGIPASLNEMTITMPEGR